MVENNIEIVEEIMQRKISQFIKENGSMDKKELAKRVEQMLDEKEKMYKMTYEQLKQELKKEK